MKQKNEMRIVRALIFYKLLECIVLFSLYILYKYKKECLKDISNQF